MRVLHVISGIDPVGGGPASALTGLAAAQSEAGLDVAVVATYAAGNDMSLAQRLRERGVGVHMVGPCGGLFFSHPQLKAILDEQISKSDIVHVHSMWEDVQHQACRIARKRNVPYIIRPCGMLDRWNLSISPVKKRLYLLWRMRRNLDRAAAVHFATEGERRSVVRLGLKSPALVEPLGIDFSEFDHLPRAGSFRQKHPALGERPYVVYLGRIHTGKGLELLVPAFAKAGLKDAALVIVGPDTFGFQQVVRRMVEENGLSDRVIFTGMLKGVERLSALVDARVLALPSYHENFGIVVVEALACGTPVVISDQVNLHPEVAEARVGAVVPTDVDALAGALREWMSNSELRRDASARAVTFARERYDAQQIARRWVSHYAKLCKRCAACAVLPGAS